MSRTAVETRDLAGAGSTRNVLAGFGNQLRRESGSWWSTRRWWTQA